MKRTAPKARDACEWWTREREAGIRTAHITKAPWALLHSSWCARSSDGRRTCTCVPITLTFGAEA